MKIYLLKLKGNLLPIETNIGLQNKDFMSFESAENVWYDLALHHKLKVSQVKALGCYSVAEFNLIETT